MKIIATQVRDGASAETKIRQNDADDDNPADDIDDGLHDVPLSVVWRAGRLAGSLRRRGFIRVDARRFDRDGMQGGFCSKYRDICKKTNAADRPSQVIARHDE